MKAYLLYEEHDFDLEAALPSHHEELIQDLELTTLFGAMAAGDKFLYEVAQRVILSSLEDPEAIVYRQHILADCLAQPEVIREMYAISVEALEGEKKIWGMMRNPSGVLSRSVTALEFLERPLRRLREIAERDEDGFSSDGFRTLFALLARELDDEYFSTIDDHLKRLKFRDGVEVSAELGTGNKGQHYVLRTPSLRRRSFKEVMGIGPRTSYSFDIPPRDDAGNMAAAELRERGLNDVANSLGKSTQHIASFFAMLRVELGFYVGCLNLAERLRAKGEPLCTPTLTPRDSLVLSFSGLIDVCLSLRIEEKVVGNDVRADDKSLVMITGANSGGKSTFLRSVGLAQLMAQSGMFVVAEAFSANVVAGVFTHFIREEDETMSSGRLDEELHRMSVLADEISPGSLVLFNESFAATNEREGSEIGRQIVRALLETNTKVFFVTHLYDLAESFYLAHAGSALFMRAERHRSYKLVEAEPLPTSFGEDLYARMGGFGSSVPPAAVVGA